MRKAGSLRTGLSESGYNDASRTQGRPIASRRSQTQGSTGPVQIQRHQNNIVVRAIDQPAAFLSSFRLKIEAAIKIDRGGVGRVDAEFDLLEADLARLSDRGLN